MMFTDHFRETLTTRELKRICKRGRAAKLKRGSIRAAVPRDLLEDPDRIVDYQDALPDGQVVVEFRVPDCDDFSVHTVSDALYWSNRKRKRRGLNHFPPAVGMMWRTEPTGHALNFAVIQERPRDPMTIYFVDMDTRNGRPVIRLPGADRNCWFWYL
jgi:hypothetical protein